MELAREKGSALAELRARGALQGAGLDPAVPLERASSVTNEVWLTPSHAVRVNRKPRNRLAREAQLAAALPPEVGYPRVVAHGGGPGEDWLVCERLPGVPLAHRWPDLSRDERRRAIRTLSARLGALHRTPAPTELPDVDAAPHLLDFRAPDPEAPVLEALELAAAQPHVERPLVDEAITLVRRGIDALERTPPTTLAHSDLTFENLLWHDGEVRAVLDFEWARAAPADLDLDVLLRCCAYPKLHVAEAHVSRTRAEDYAQVPIWLAADYPELFAGARLLDRLRLYAVAYNVRELLDDPPPRPERMLTPAHPYSRLARVVRRHSHLDALAPLLSGRR